MQPELIGINLPRTVAVDLIKRVIDALLHLGLTAARKEVLEGLPAREPPPRPRQTAIKLAMRVRA